MKKVLLVTVLMLMIASVSFAQLGIKGGLMMATLGGDDSKIALQDNAGNIIGFFPPATKTGLTGGISYKVGLALGLSIQPELLYVQKGAMVETNYMGANIKVTAKTDFIEIPVLVKFNLPIPIVSPFIEAGASYGILLSGKIKSEVSIPGSSSMTTEVDIKESLAKGNVSLIVGVGVELAIIEVNARYIMGMSKIDKDGLAKTYHRGIMLTAGLRF